MVRRLSLIASLLLASPATAAPPEPARQRVDLIYTGQTGGVSTSATYGAKHPIMLLWDYLTARQGAASLDRTGWVLRQGPCLLIDPDDMRTARTTQILGERRRKPRVLVERIPYLESDHVIVFQYPLNPKLDLLGMMAAHNRQVPQDPMLRRGVGRLLEYHTPAGQRVLALDQSRGAGEGLELPAEPLSWLPTEPTSWETWWGGRGQARLKKERGTYYLVVKMRGYGARRLRFIQGLRGGLEGQPLLLSAGDEVDAFNPVRGKSSTRDLDFEVLGLLRYTAIVPGGRELYFGVDELKQQARKHKLSLVATNLRHASGDKSGQHIFERYLVRRIGGVNVGILGLVSTDLGDRVHDPTVFEGVKIDDPFEASAKALMEMHSSPQTRPDYVIVLSNLRDAALTQYLAAIRGASVVIGDFTRAPEIYPASETIDARARRNDLIRQRSPLLEVHGSWTQVGHVAAHFEGAGPRHQIERLVHVQRAITADMPRSDWLHRRVMAAELRDRDLMESVLIPSLDTIVEGSSELVKYIRQDPEFVRAFPLDQEDTGRTQMWFTPRLWSNVVANIVRDAARAEVAIVRSVNKLTINTPGAVLLEYVLGWASTEETLVVYDMTGAQLRQLVHMELGETVFAGLDSEEMKIGGRDLADDERYRVAIGSSIATSGPVSRLIGDLEGANKFTLGAGRVVESRKGRAVRVREVVLAVLQESRRRDPRFGKGYIDRFRGWLVPGGKTLVPRWSIRVENLAVTFSNYANYPGSSWQNFRGVRETRVATPDSYTLGGKGTLSVLYDARRFSWETRGWFELARTVVSTDTATTVLKNADDLQASTELRLKLIGLEIGERRIELQPYLNATFDTEFTPTTNFVTGETYTHQKELYGSLGMVTFPGQMWQEVRIAGVVRTDFAASRGIVDAGLLFGTRAEFPIWKAKLNVGGTLRYFISRATDTEDRLGLIFQAEAKLSVPFTRDLSLTLAADLYLFRPKVMTYTDLASGESINRGAACSLILSAGIAFDHTWKL